MTAGGKIHLREPNHNFPRYHFDSRLYGKPGQLTMSPTEVTCKRCLSAMRKGGNTKGG